MGMAEGLAVADCRAWFTAVFPRPGPLSPGRVPDRLARIQPAAQGGKRVRPGSRKAGWVPAKAASRALQAGDRRRRIFCLKLMRKVARPAATMSSMPSSKKLRTKTAKLRKVAFL